MKDLNFFSTYSKRTERKVNKNLLFYSIVILVTLSMVFYYAYNFVLMRRANKDLLASKTQIEEIETNEKIKDVLDKEAKIEELKEDVARLKALDDYVKEKDIINEGLLLTITNAIPGGLYLRNMVLNVDSISIDGKALDKEAVAQFQHNLNKLDVFETIFVPGITYNENYYSFNMNIKFREEDKDERKAEAKPKKAKN